MNAVELLQAEIDVRPEAAEQLTEAIVTQVATYLDLVVAMELAPLESARAGVGLEPREPRTVLAAMLRIYADLLEASP